MDWRRTDGRTRFAAIAWVAVLVVAALFLLSRVALSVVHARAYIGGEAAVPWAIWLAIDYCTVVWILGLQLACLALAVCAFANYRVVVRRDRLLESKAARRRVIAGAVLSSVGAVVLAGPIAITACALSIRQGCKTTRFEEALSPDGRYRATVSEVDCGAFSRSHRQVLLTREPLSWAATTILYLEGEPPLHLSWKGRTLTIEGERPLGSMSHPPPDPVVWGGVLVRYSGPTE